MTGLLQLPNEVLDIISDDLGAQDFSALRLTSKRLNSATLPAFSRRYFKTRYVMFSRLSLQNLVEIARHPVFGPSVRILEVCVDHFVQFPELSPRTALYEADIAIAIEEGRRPPVVSASNISGGYSSEEEEGQGPRARRRRTDEGSVSSQDSDKAPMDRVAYRSLWEDQEHILETGFAQAYITQALIALTNAEVIVISNMHRPWGALAHGLQTGLPPTNMLDCFEWDPFVRRVLHIVLTAIAMSGAAPGGLDIVPASFMDAITPDILIPPEANLQHYKSLPSSLTELTLNISDEGKRGFEHRWADDLSAFISMFQHLTRLDLIITRDHLVPPVDRFKGLVPKLHLPKLRFLVLDSVYCSAQDLGALIVKHKATLQKATLAHVKVSGSIDDWKSLFTLIRAHLAGLKLSIECCVSGNLALMYRVEEREDAHLFEANFDVGGSNENWTAAIHAIDAM